MSYRTQRAEIICTPMVSSPSTKTAADTMVEQTSLNPPLRASVHSDQIDPYTGCGARLKISDISAAAFRSVAPSLALLNAPATPTLGKSVLIVDDVAMNREVAGSILRTAGYDVICVSGGAEAIAAVKGTEFDVVLMDVRMPQMDGLEATRQIRALQGRRGQVPILALTAQDFPQEIVECRKAGMIGHVSKPFDPETLAVAVVRAMLPRLALAASDGPEFVTVSTPPPMVRETGSQLRIINPETFKRTASFVAPKALASYLKKIAALTKALLVMLDGPDIPEYDAQEFAGAAHIVAGTAGMFGFERLTEVSQQFERATESSTSEATPSAEALSAAIRDTLPEIRSRMLAATGV